jgi:hypothetical protein
MKLLLRIALLSALWVPYLSLAQELTTKSAPTNSDNPSAVQNHKPYWVSPDNMLMRCKVPTFLKCMKWSESECVAVINKAVAEGNQKVEAEAASKSQAETSDAMFISYATGVVVGTIHAASKGKLLGCLKAK